MKILIDAHLSENQQTGIGRYLSQLICTLIKNDKINNYILLANQSLNKNHPLQKINSGNLRRISVPLHGPGLRQQILIPRLLRSLKPDVYHHPHFDLPFFIQIPSVITVHDLKYIKHPEFFSKQQQLKSRYMKLMLQSAVKRATKIIAVSENTKNEIMSLYNINKKKIQVVYHGYKEFNMKNNGKKILNKLGIFKPYILYVGERRPHKNIKNLLYGFHTLISNQKLDLQLVIVGKKYADYKNPELLINNLHLQNKVILTDAISDIDLAHLYKNAEMFVLPSFYEGFGMPILEAMNANIPVLGSNTTSIPEIIGEAGLLFNPNDVKEIAEKMEKVLKNKKIRNTLIEKGKKRLKKFSWDQTASQTLEIYHQVAAVPH